MTPDEVFAQLRDIHMPETVAATASGQWSGLDPRPLVAFALILALVIALPALGRWHRHRKLKADVDQLAQSPPPEQRDRLALLARTLPRTRQTPPSGFFTPPDRIGTAEVETLRHWVKERIG